MTREEKRSSQDGASALKLIRSFFIKSSATKTEDWGSQDSSKWWMEVFQDSRCFIMVGESNLSNQIYNVAGETALFQYVLFSFMMGTSIYVVVQ